MENNNGRGIFYGVIGVATLVVAIIGATFAYFSASAASNNAVHVGATTLSLKFLDEKDNFYTDMIPVDSDDTNFKLYPGLTARDASKGTVGKGTCTDDRGNAICGVYEFTINNPSTTVAQTVNGSLTVVKNGFTNLKYAVFKGSAAAIKEAKGGFDVNQTTAKKVDEAAIGELVVLKDTFGVKDDTDTWTNTQQLLQPTASQTYTVVVWLEEAADANNAEQGQLFSANIKFDTGTGSGVTGTLSAAS